MFFAAAVVVLLLDQISKQIIQSRLTPGETLPVLREILSLTLVTNTRGAFGIVGWPPVVFVICTAILVILLTLYSRRVKGNHLSVLLSLGLISGGACGNAADRIMLGYVVDFIDVHVWPVFNVADMAISVGVGWLILQTLLTRDEAHGKVRPPEDGARA